MYLHSPRREIPLSHTCNPFIWIFVFFVSSSFPFRTIFSSQFSCSLQTFLSDGWSLLIVIYKWTEIISRIISVNHWWGFSSTAHVAVHSYVRQMHIYLDLLILVNKANLVHNSFSMFIYILFMFRATICPSSGETIEFIRHLALVILYGWRSGMQVHMLLYTRPSSIQNNKYQVSNKHSCLSWWWAHSWPKHVEKRNKHTKKNFAPSWLYLQYYTGMHG